MKAVVQRAYGPPAEVLSLDEVAEPVARDDEVLVGVRAASVHPDVWHVVTGLPYPLRLMGSGLRKPHNPIPGTDMAGVVEAVGKNVTRLAPGDEVFGETVDGFQWKNGGTFAERVTVAADALALKPPNVTFEQAASVPTAGYIAINCLRLDGRMQSGQRILINGAGGGVGSLALQIAKANDTEVTAVDHTDKLGMLRELGADRVVDYIRDDFTQLGERYDLILDIPGNHSFLECRRALTPKGMHVLVGHDQFGQASPWLGSIGRMFERMAASVVFKQLPTLRSAVSTESLVGELRELLESKKLTPIIDKTFSLGEAAEAIRYLAEGRARGRVVLVI